MQPPRVAATRPCANTLTRPPEEPRLHPKPIRLSAGCWCSPTSSRRSAAPASAHLVGLLVHHRPGVPWVADFRDEWTENPEAGKQPRLYRAASRLLERLVLRAATRVIVTTDDARLAGPPLPAGKCRTISNRVD